MKYYCAQILREGRRGIMQHLGQTECNAENMGLG